MSTACLDDEVRGLVWSPDGSALAWVQGGHVAVHDFTYPEPNLRRMESEATAASDTLAWMPGAAGVVAVIDGGEGGWDLAVIDADGNSRPLVTGPARVAAPLVDPGGRLMIHAEFRPGGADVVGWLADEERSAPLIEAPGDQIPLALGDGGRFLVYLQVEDGQTDLWVRDFEFLIDQRLTETPAVETMARWLPQSTSVVFAAQDGTRGEVWVVDVREPEPDRIWRGEGVVTDVEWGRGGTDVFACAGGRLLRMTDRGRRDRTWVDIGRRIHDVAVSPDGETLAVAGQTLPFLLDAAWEERPRPVSGAWEETLDLGAVWAEAHGPSQMRLLFGQWISATESARQRSALHRRLGEALSRAGEHEEAIDQFAVALQASIPADPELHRLFGEEMLLFQGNIPRARVALNNHQAERLRVTPIGESPAPPSLDLQVLRRSSQTTPEMVALAGWRRARAECKWSVAAVAFAGLVEMLPDMRSALAGEGRQMLEEMTGDLPDSAAALVTTGDLLLQLIRDADARWEIEEQMIVALLTEGHWEAAARVIAQIIAEHGGGEPIDRVLALSAEALMRESLGRARWGEPMGARPSRATAALWRSAELVGAMEETATPSQQLTLAALRAYAAFLGGRSGDLTHWHNRVVQLTESHEEFDPPALGSVAVGVVHSLRGYQMLRERRWGQARGAFDAAVDVASRIADEHPDTLEDNGLADAAMACAELAAAIGALADVDDGRDALADDWRLQGLHLWVEAVPLALPQPTGERSAWDEEALEHANHMREIARRQSRLADRAESSVARGHARLNQARAVAAAGDTLGALSLLRVVAEQTESDFIARAALWQIARIQRGQGDAHLTEEAIDAWADHDPPEREWLILEAWEGQGD